MDIFAHGLWTNIVFYKKYKKEKSQRLVAVLFGILPDLITFTPAALYVLAIGTTFSPELFKSNFWMFRYAAASYNFTHSIVIFLVVMIIVAIIRKWKMYPNKNVFHPDSLLAIKKISLPARVKLWLKGYGMAIYWPMCGWGLHILIDIPTHKNFFETPFLFPLSNYRFGNGISWKEPGFMAINYGTLILIYSFWFFISRKRKN